MLEPTCPSDVPNSLVAKMRQTFLLILTVAAIGAAKDCNNSAMTCKPGLLLPAWEPKTNISMGTVAYRAVVYFAALCYFFLGVSVVSDRFMTAIEVITSKEKELKVPGSFVDTWRN